MNLLQEFEGLSGEVLASAALRVLMLESPAIRDSILDVLSFGSQIGPLVCSSHFACYRELATIDEGGSSGRLDLVLECDNAILGIEAKFSAAFQPQQPSKYSSTLSKRAELLSALRGIEGSVQAQLYILAPESRRAESQRESPTTPFVAWEEIIQAVHGSSAEAIRPLVEDLSSYVRARLEFLPHLERDIPHLGRSFPRGGTELQVNFLRSIYFDALGLSGARISRGEDYCGYALTQTRDAWLGFIPATDATTSRGALLVLASNRDLQLSDPPFRSADCTRPVYLLTAGKYVPASHHWVVSVTSDWKRSDYVRSVFRPVLSSPESHED